MRAVKPRFLTLFPARVAELADAVDSKSTDESLVGSTPTPGTILIGELILGDGEGTKGRLIVPATSQRLHTPSHRSKGQVEHDQALVSWLPPISTLSHARFSRVLRACHG